MASNAPTPTSTFKPAIGGSGVTVMRWNPVNLAGNDIGPKTPAIIAFCRVTAVTEPPPVAPPTAVQPLEHIRPVEIVTAAAQTNGTITLTMYQLYNQQIWHRLAGLAGSTDITDILRNMNRWDHLTITRQVRPPVPNQPSYKWDYEGCKLASIGDDMAIDVTTTVLEKDMTFWYRRYTFSSIDPSPQYINKPDGSIVRQAIKSD